MSWRLGNSIRLSLQTGLQLLRTSSDGEDINRAWEKENIRTSATGSSSAGIEAALTMV